MLSDADNMTALFKGMVGTTMFIAIVALINLEGKHILVTSTLIV